MNEDMEKYEKLISLPHFEPKFHKRMPAEMRAAQFAPFSALTGLDDAISATVEIHNQEKDERLSDLSDEY